MFNNRGGTIKKIVELCMSRTNCINDVQKGVINEARNAKLYLKLHAVSAIKKSL